MNTCSCAGLLGAAITAAPVFGWLLFHWRWCSPDVVVAAELSGCLRESIMGFCGEVDLLVSSEGEEVLVVSVRLTVVMSCMLALLLSLPPESCLMKYFWAWLATWVGVLVMTKLREMFLQSPLPYFFRPSRNNLEEKYQKGSLNSKTKIRKNKQNSFDLTNP